MARDLTKGSIPGHIIALAVPAVLSMFAIVANNFIDTALVGHLGDSELAAVGSAAFFIWLMFSIIDLFSVGTVALISRDFGAGNLKQASERSMHIMKFAFWFSLTLALIGAVFSRQIFSVLNLAPDVERMGEVYLMVVFLAVPALFLSEVLSAIFRSVGDTKTPMIIMIAAVGLNIVLDIILIYGLWIFPRLETLGAALATTIAHTAGVFLAFYFVLKGKIPFRVIPKNLFPIDLDTIGKMTRIGLPITIAGFVFCLVYIGLIRIMSEFGTAAVAAIPVGNRIESISYMTCFGFYMATSSLVGQNLGARRPERASTAAWTSAAIISVITFMFGLLFYIFPREIADLLTNEVEVIEVAVLYLKILAISQIFMGLEFVLEGAFSGAGNTMPPMVVSIPGTVLRIPLGYYLGVSLNMGPAGIFWAITFSTVVKGIAMTIWFKAGRWMKKEV